MVMTDCQKSFSRNQTEHQAVNYNTETISGKSLEQSMCVQRKCGLIEFSISINAVSLLNRAELDGDSAVIQV